MCGLFGNVETFLVPRRCNVRALKAGRMQRVERENVFDSIGKYVEERRRRSVSMLQSLL